MVTAWKSLSNLAIMMVLDHSLIQDLLEALSDFGDACQ
jgi:hypothetical protein